MGFDGDELVTSSFNLITNLGQFDENNVAKTGLRKLRYRNSRKQRLRVQGNPFVVLRVLFRCIIDVESGVVSFHVHLRYALTIVRA